MSEAYNRRLSRLKYPLIQGGMGIGISMGKLAGTVAFQGAMGVISTANIGFREDDFWDYPDRADERALRAEIRKAREISCGNGLIAINAMTVTNNYRLMIQTAIDEGIDAIISGAGLPLSLPDITAGKDVMIAPVVSSSKAASAILNMWKKRYDRTADFIVVEGSMAGGHLGFSREKLDNGSCQPLTEIVGEIKKLHSDIPIFAGGSVFDRKDIKTMQDNGAWGVQIATRFITAKECDATDGYKKVILEASSGDAAILDSPVGMPGRAVRTPLVEKTAKGMRSPAEKCIRCISTCDPATAPYCINKALIEAFYGNYSQGLFFCGANVGRTDSMTTVKDIIEELFPDTDDLKDRSFK